MDDKLLENLHSGLFIVFWNFTGIQCLTLSFPAQVTSDVGSSSGVEGFRCCYYYIIMIHHYYYIIITMLLLYNNYILR